MTKIVEFTELPFNVQVYVYIPGGGFTSGGAHSWYKVPDQLVQARQDVVFVIMK